MLDGLGGTDTLVGIEGVAGSGFADRLIGDAFANVFRPLGDNDTFDGRSGSDLVDYSVAGAGVTVVLSSTGWSTGILDGQGGTDVLIAAENVLGSSFADLLLGDGAANTIVAGAGNDILSGAAGADTLDGGAGDDTQIGGAGADPLLGGTGSNDVVDLSIATVGVTLTLNGAAQAVFADGFGSFDTLSGVENLIGSAAADSLCGDGLNNSLFGGSGDDVLFGAGGFDTRNGGDGLDTALYDTTAGALTVTLAGGAGGTIVVADGLGVGVSDVLISIEGISGSSAADTVVGDAGANYLRGNRGVDTLDGGGGIDLVGFDSSANAITLTLDSAASFWVSDGLGNSDWLVSIEGVVGSSLADTLSGDGGANTFRGLASNYTIDGKGGADLVDYLAATTGVALTLNSAGVVSNATDGQGGLDALISIEGVAGSQFADTFVGDSVDNLLIGREGNDTLRGNSGSDTFDGGAGFDVADFTGATSGVTVVLNSAATLLVNDGQGGTDLLISIEGVIGGTATDTLTGDGGGNTLAGGADSDTVDYSSAAAGITLGIGTTVTVGDGLGGTDILINVETVVGSGFADRLAAPAATLGQPVYRLFGGGNDALAGSAPGFGGISAWTLDGGQGEDWRDLSTWLTGVNLSLSSTGTVAGVSCLGTNFGAFRLEHAIGSAFADVLKGDSGAGTLRGLAGNDTLDGGGGSDVADYLGTAAAGTIDLSAAVLGTLSNVGDGRGVWTG